VQSLAVDVWSDIACPWCYVGKRRLEAALGRFAHGDQVEVRWRAFELDPHAAAERDAGGGDYAARLARKYGTSRAQAEAMIARMTATAAADGIEMRFDRTRPGNTFDAHRLIHHAATRGVQGAMKERLLRAYFTEGVAIGQREALVPLALEVGLDEAEVREVLTGDAGAREVRADEDEARALGITGVPFFVIGGRLGVSGAHPADVLVGALERGWQLAAEPAEAPHADGAACGPDGCD
jgi:predicted DsbA family dithiol-disulfide isomerase